jgi:hypothetical protein
MKIATSILTGAALLAMAQAAQAAVPKVQGKYAYNSVSLCQALVTTNKDTQGKVTSVNPAQGGSISVDTGYITFPAVAASSGTMSVAGNGFGGDTVRINNSGVAIKPYSTNPSGTFTLTGTTLTFAGQVFLMTYGNVVGGVARTINLVQNEKENPRCINSITATKQP